MNNNNNICFNCGGTVFPVFYYDEDEQEFMVDYLICNSCGKKETVSHITRKEWLKTYE